MDQNLLPTDPRVLKVQGYAKTAGTVLVVGAASVAVIAVGTSLLMASVIAVAGLVMVNFVVPVTARAVALWRINTITKLTEAFSEETIREDEKKEGDRIRQLEQDYVTSRSELEGAQEELRKQLKTALPDEKDVLQSQMDSLQGVIDDAEDTLKTRKTDFAELQRVNKQYIALYRAATAMGKAQGAVRNSNEIQQVETARNSIKTKMRAAMAGKTIEQMNKVAKKASPLEELATTKRRSHEI